MIEYKLNRDLKVIKDGHVMFMEDVLTDLKRKSFLENERTVKTARIDEIINFVNLLSSDIERSASETIVAMLEKLKGN